MAKALQFDHIVIVVRDLEVGIADYESLGFRVTRGGEHKSWATHNALVPLADGSYLELIAFKRSWLEPGHSPNRRERFEKLHAQARSPVECRVLPWETVGEGLADFALLPGSAQAAIDGARERGLPMVGPLPGSRVRPDGEQVAWEFGLPETCDVPFLCADVTPRHLRVPGGGAREHANGVVGIVDLTVAVRDLNASAARYAALLDAHPRRRAQAASFALGAAIITLVAPHEADPSIAVRLGSYGEGPCALTLRTTDPSHAGRLDPARTHGATAELVAP